ncbi:MAG: hypothetical protein RL275_2842 [Chloroflexota bacterium]|jgi:hypothetical protein
MKTKIYLDSRWVFPISFLLIIIIDLLTNTINTTQNQWDFAYYIALAKDGFNAEPLASPFAYRFFTPGLVHLLSLTGLSIENGFLVIAYFGAIAQLMGIFYFVQWLTKSNRGAWIALFVTAFSMFNIKFLVFDPFRPDHLAYALILLQTYFAFERRFLPLLILTIIGSTIREFTLVPLAAYLFMVAQDSKMRTLAAKQDLIAAILVLPAVFLPRYLIPVTENFQLIGLSTEGLLNAIALFFIPSFPVNFIFSIIAYFLPLFLLANLTDVRTAFQQLPNSRRSYLIGYSVLVLILSFFGGTDYNRFATFLFLPQIILIGLLDQVSNTKLALTFFCLFIFNRLWMHIPDWDVQTYRDFFGGFALQLNLQTAYRYAELFLFIAIGVFMNRKRQDEIPTV